jgi:two-component system cell cycle sensor histidine kinase/response regulator CckA
MRKSGRQSVRAARPVVVVVDDEQLVLSVMTRVLEKAGYTVLTAHDGEHALAVMQAYHARVDLIVTDIVMPRMDGLELVALLHGAYPSLRALLVSGKTQYVVDNRHRMDDDTRFLAKPFTPTEFLDSVNAILN